MPVHPTIAAKFPLLESITSFTSAMSDPAQREALDRCMTPAASHEPARVPTAEATVPGPHGPVPVRIYQPESRVEGRPCLVWMHGGAFVGGDLDMPEADWTARQVCRQAGAVVVSVDYRLCQDGVHYPVPHDDVVAAFRWVRDNAGAMQIDPARISIGGASAGGTLAIGAALKLRDVDGSPPAALLPIYPVAHAMLPAPNASTSAKLAGIPTVLRFPPEVTLDINVNYLGGAVSSADGYAFGAHAQLEGLCPTLVINAEYDDLRPSGEDFVARCAVAGVEVRQVTAAGLLHGFLNTDVGLEPVTRAYELISAMVRNPTGGP